MKEVDKGLNAVPSKVTTRTSDMVLGMFPENWFFDRSNSSKDFMFPTSKGSSPLRKFEDKLRNKRYLRVHIDEVSQKLVHWSED